MQRIVIIVVFLVSVIASRAQDPFVEALANLDTNRLSQSFELRQDSIHRELVVETIVYAKRWSVQIEKDAAFKLDKIYFDASTVAASESETSENWQLFPANRKRFIARLISEAEPQPVPQGSVRGPLQITTKTVETIQSDLLSLSFCPCWPFCK